MSTVKTILLMIAIILFGCGPKNEKPNSGSGGNNGAQVLSVEGVIAKEENSENILYATGTVLANEEVELRSEITGKITKILFKEGSNVSAGQLLVKLNDKEIQAELQKAVYERKLLEEKESRQKQLLTINAISQEEYDASLNALNVAKATISMLQAQIEKTEIRAPFNGTIGLKNVSEGANISPTTLIASLQSVTPVKIDFSVPEKYSGKVTTGTKINFTLEGSDKTFVASVYAIEPRIDPISRTLKIRAVYPNKDRSILPGSFANIQLQLADSIKAILIPTQALIPDISGAKVFVSEAGKATARQVKTGLRTETHIEILEGLEAGDTILTSGILQLKPGIHVEVEVEVKN